MYIENHSKISHSVNVRILSDATQAKYRTEVSLNGSTNQNPTSDVIDKSGFSDIKPEWEVEVDLQNSSSDSIQSENLSASIVDLLFRISPDNEITIFHSVVENGVESTQGDEP